MRVGGRGLPLLIALTLLGIAAPAGAEDGAGFGVRDGVVDADAGSHTPGSGGSTSDGAPSRCTWRVVIADDLTKGVFGPSGERLYSDTGRWLQKVCDGEVEIVDGLFVIPEGGSFAIADLLEQARRTLDPPAPTWSASPNGTTVPMVTQLPTWLWVNGDYWNGGFSARASTPSGRVWAEARATPTSALWQIGDGSTVSCGAGTAWQAGPQANSSDCTYTFRHSTAGTAGTPLSVSVTFDVAGVTSLGGTAELGALTRTSPPALVQVAEIQAIESNGR